MKNQLVISNAKMKKELKEIEDKILFLLSNSQGNILDDEELIDTLAKSKVTSNEISAKVQEAEKLRKRLMPQGNSTVPLLSEPVCFSSVFLILP